MTPSQELQIAIHAVLTGSTALAALVGGRIYDGNPPEGAAFPRITYGPSDFVPEQLDCIDARQEMLQIDIWSRRNGERFEAAAIVDTVYAILNGADLSLGTHAVATCEVTLARVFRDPDGITAHGVVQVEALVERNG